MEMNSSSTNKLQPGEVVHIAGAGPAGLAAAITLSKAGVSVVVHEAQSTVGHRFGRDLQGLENWSDKKDVLEELTDFGISTDFDRVAYHGGHVFDAWGREYVMRSQDPTYYLIERGPGPQTVDTALLNQAKAMGVEIRFNHRVTELASPCVLATGPKAADAIAVGYHFDTDMADGVWVICDNRLAPQGYAYLLIMNGLGTIKSCMFSDFKHEQKYVQRTVSAFERLVGLRMQNAKAHGGVGNFHLPTTMQNGRRPVVGEQAGFQDTLWGFGIRYAIRSGVMAAKGLLQGEDYNARWKREFLPMMRASVVNRVLFKFAGNWGYRLFLATAAQQTDSREFLRRQYRLSAFTRVAWPLAHRYYESKRKDAACHDADCHCVWCRCG